jgi:hypothetical protein
VKTLNDGVAVSRIWDAVLAASGDAHNAGKPGIVALHSVTSSNALRFAYESRRRHTRRAAHAPQNAAFVTLFRPTAASPTSRRTRVDQFEPAPPTAADGPAALDEIFAEAGKDRLTGRPQNAGLPRQGRDAHDLMHAARRLVFLKGNDAQTYKFSSRFSKITPHVSPRLAQPLPGLEPILPANRARPKDKPPRRTNPRALNA